MEFFGPFQLSSEIKCVDSANETAVSQAGSSDWRMPRVTAATLFAETEAQLKCDKLKWLCCSNQPFGNL